MWKGIGSFDLCLAVAVGLMAIGWQLGEIAYRISLRLDLCRYLID